jgi:DNA-binding transcriptional LysR family regulator
MYTPQSRPGLTLERLLEERLVMVSTEEAGGSQSGEGYVYVDWGAEFYAQHSVHFPEYAGAGVVANTGWLGLEHILQAGGSGYFPFRVVAPHLESGRLHHLSLAPEFRLPAYAVYPDDPGSDAVALALEAMRQIAAGGREPEHSPAQHDAAMRSGTPAPRPSRGVSGDAQRVS